MKKLRVILSNQLNENISSLQDFDLEQDIVLICETKEEFTYVKHHQKKIAFLISAMRHFAKELEDKGFPVIYVKFDDPQNTHLIIEEIIRISKIIKANQIIITWPSRYEILQELNNLHKKLKLPIEIKEDDSFLATKEEFKKWAEGRKNLRMEFFYRQMRQKYNILMQQDNQPIGNKWNFDFENRKSPPHELNIPNPFKVSLNKITKEALKLVEKHFSDHFGDLLSFNFAVNRTQALQALDLFINQRLKKFGTYQDAMLEDEPWMYHSHLSFYINCGLLEPMECIKAAELAYYQGDVSINAAEGFIRQILGWREYIRGVYWLKMPEYKNLNFFNAKRLLPDFYWSADTKMNCLKQCVTQTKQNAYAHHIQRLMVLGNFALIAGINPKYVNEWYLIVYADAYEWVELPNVTGMILFADGGLIASKPYAASGAYINKMSNYCQNCSYKVFKKTGPKACPFNYLYWNFLIENQAKLEKNHRLNIGYQIISKMSPNKISSIQLDSQNFLESLKYYES
jgi:deoxyribodipyrimidine photolyase-related protein